MFINNKTFSHGILILLPIIILSLSGSSSLKYEIISAKGTNYSSFEEVAAAGKKVQSSAGNNVANAIERWNEANPSKKITLEYVESNTTQDQLQKIIDGDYVGIGDIPVYASYKKEMLSFPNGPSIEYKGYSKLSLLFFNTSLSFNFAYFSKYVK